MALVNNTTNAYTPDTNPTLNTHRASGMPEVGANGGSLPVTTTNIDVYANGLRVGFVQSFSPSESRNIIKVQELGTEGVVQSVPSNTNGGQLSVSRFAVYNSDFYNAVSLTKTGQFIKKADGNPFRTLKEQRVPLEFKVKTTIPTGSESFKYIIDTYVDCWLASYTKTISATTITVTEQSTIQYSDVFQSITTS